MYIVNSGQATDSHATTPVPSQMLPALHYLHVDGSGRMLVPESAAVQSQKLFVGRGGLIEGQAYTLNAFEADV